MPTSLTANNSLHSSIISLAILLLLFSEGSCHGYFGSAALVTGAHGGIGRAFIADMLKRGVAKIYVTRHRRARERLTDSAEPARLPQPETEHDSTSDPKPLARSNNMIMGISIAYVYTACTC